MPHKKFLPVHKLQEKPIKMSTIGNIAKNVLKHLHKRVMDNRLIGNDELHLFTVSLKEFSKNIVSWADSVGESGSTIQNFV